MTEYNRKEITALGWSLARATAEKHGGKPREYFSAAMAEVWRLAREGWDGEDESEEATLPIPSSEPPIEYKGLEVTNRGRFIVLRKFVRPNVYCSRSIGDKWNESVADKAASEIYASLAAARDYERDSKKMLC